MAHDIGYTGPPDEYMPPQGFNTSPNASNIIGPKTVTYADINYLNQILNTLLSDSNALLQNIQATLSNLSLVVTTDPNDANLKNAHEILWPSTLGAAPTYITYAYYASLLGNNTAAAQKIIAAYEDAARGVTGNNAIDLIPLIQTTIDEGNLIQNYANMHAGDLSDSSQRQSVQMLQDWVESANTQLKGIAAAAKGPIANLDTTALSAMTAADASNVQAILHVNLNQLNTEIKKNLGVLQKNFVTYQSTFYNNVLGPAMNLRNNAITQIYPHSLPGALKGIVGTSTDNLQNHLQAVLTDQMRRNQFYVTQVQSTLQLVTARDTYKNYINQLASPGTSIPIGTSGTLISATDTPAAAALFQNIGTATTTVATTNPYLSPHSSLSGLFDPNAHPQYLSKYGDTLYGNLQLATPDSNSLIQGLIDGIHPSTHAHTGMDGTAQIHGESIVPASLTPAAINTSLQPSVPTGLTLGVQSVDLIAGVGSVDVPFTWMGDNNLLYEVQITKINKSNVNLATPNSIGTGALTWWNSCYLFRRNLTIDIMDTLPLNHPVTIALDAHRLIEQLMKVRSDLQDIVVVYTDESANPPIQIPIPCSANRDGVILNITFNTQQEITISGNGNYSIYYGNPSLIGSPTLDNYTPNPWPISIPYNSPRVTYTSPNIQWIDGVSTLAGSRAAFTFTGSAVQLIAGTGLSNGIGSVQVDNNNPIEIDFYSNGASTTAAYPSGLSRPLLSTVHSLIGQHTVRVVNFGMKNAGANNTKIEISRFEYLGYASPNDLGEESNPTLDWSTNTGGVTNSGSNG